nr:regulatory protein ral2 [Cryptococcus depauperatus CBS 7841]
MDAGTAHIMSWSEPTKGQVPPPLTGPSLTISPLPAPHPPTVFLFGGKSVQTRHLTAEMWAMDLGTRIWERVDAGDGPSPRYFHSMDVWESMLVCFGGMSESNPMAVHNDIWFFDCLSRKWLPQPSPSEPVGLGLHSMSQDPALLPSARYAHLSAVSRGQLVVSGGQHSDNSWIYEINVYDLENRLWVSKTEQPQASGMYSKGAYRSVATSSKKRVVVPHARQGADGKSANTHSYSVDEEGGGGGESIGCAWKLELIDQDIWCYSNYDFAKVRRELDVIAPDGTESVPSAKHSSPPDFVIRDESHRMRGSSQPPGLRFPTGGIVGNHFILCGLYLASVSGAFSIWALNLDTMTWKHLEPQVLSSGSWNRALVWTDKAKVLVFGNSQYDLASDYSRRAVNLDHVAVISLETFGIYQPPTLVVPTKLQQAGLSMLDEKLASDFEVVCDDGRRVKCSKRILSERWPWFAEQEQELRGKAQGIIADAPSVDINDTLMGSFSPARLTPGTLTMSEPFPVCVALVQYFYTLSLATPLQNRAPVLSALLFMAKQYKIERLNKLVVHVLHERLDHSNAVGIYEIATLAGEQCLQVRALNMIHGTKTSSSRRDRQGPVPSLASEGTANGTTQSDASRSAPGAASTPTTNVPFGATRPGAVDDAPHRRTRVDSLTVPEEIVKALPRVEPLQNDDDKVNALLAALDVSSRRPESISQEPPIKHQNSSKPLSSTHSAQSATASPAIPQRHHSRLPPIAPPPRTRPPSFPRTPEFALPAERPSFNRPSSPTNSDVTSNYPPTPSESLRESWILPQHREWSFSTGLGGTLLDSRSSSSSGIIGLPSLPEDDAIPSQRLSTPRNNYNAFADPYSNNLKLTLPSSEVTGLLPPASLREGLQQIRMDSPTMSQSSYDFGASSMYGSPISGRPSTATSVGFGTNLSAKNNRHFSIATQSSGASNPLSPTGTDWSEDTGQMLKQQTMAYLQSGFDCGSSISSGSTGTSSKKAVKAEAKAIKAAEKYAKKAEAQSRFEALRAEQQKKMALSKAEAQRKADIAAAKEKEEMDRRAKQQREQPKSKWGKLTSGFKEAVLFPEGGSNSTMF